MSNLFKLLFADDESVVSSSICEDSANQNQKQSHDDLTNPNPSNAIERSDNVINPRKRMCRIATFFLSDVDTQKSNHNTQI